MVVTISIISCNYMEKSPMAADFLSGRTVLSPLSHATRTLSHSLCPMGWREITSSSIIGDYLKAQRLLGWPGLGSRAPRTLIGGSFKEIYINLAASSWQV